MATRFTSLGVKGTLTVVGLTTLALVTLSNTLTLQSGINFTPTVGTTTGAFIQVSGTTELQIFRTACTNTGGLAKYPTCLARSPLTTTGAVRTITLECGNTNKALSMSGGFVKASTTAVSASFPTLRTISVGTGGHFAYNALATSGSYTLWNPADLLKFQTVTSIPAGGIDCLVRTEMYDKYGS